MSVTIQEIYETYLRDQAALMKLREKYKDRPPHRTVYKESEIVDEFEACPYCGNNRGSRFSCCGEVHFETMYEMSDGEFFLESEITIEKECI
jgi:hypothetical protein